MHLFWQKGQKIQSTECFKTSAIVNVRFCESYFKLKVNGRAVASQTSNLFVADSSPLDCCDLVVFFPPYVCRSATVCIFEVVSAVLFLSFGVSCLPAWLWQPFFVCHQLLWFGLSFIWCQLFACLIRAAIFHLPPKFVVWSFFLCHRHLWSALSGFFVTGICVQFLSYLAFSAVGIRARLSVFAFFLS